MSILLRDGKFDVVIAAGPRIEHWPTVGVRALSTLCSELGLSVGLFGRESAQVRGVLPLPGTGGLLVVEDVQNRIHRIHSRAIVRLESEPSLPDPFPGWRSQGLIPYSTAMKLRRRSEISWGPCVVVLGSGNKALRFASALLESGTEEVICVESNPQWGAKRFAGWEVERRRFEMLGGELFEGKPAQLTPKGPLHWELKLKDNRGVRVLEVARVVSIGPFRDTSGIKEYPPGSFLFELEQTAESTRDSDVEGWVMEEERGKFLAAKIIRALVHDLGPRREEVDQIYRRSRGRLKRYLKHREEPFTPSYQGKWLSAGDNKKIRSFSGAPQKAHHTQPIASVECFEEIPCDICQKVCPEVAIDIGKVPRKVGILTESKCTGCGICVSACPSQVISLIQGDPERSNAQLTVAWRGEKEWKVGNMATLLNREGKSLGSARVSSVTPELELVQLETPSHLLWEARAIRTARTPATEDAQYMKAVSKSASFEEKVDVTLNGEKRRVRDKVSVSLALFEIGQSRPEDVLFCPDGSCGLCQIQVDGVKKLACQTDVHKGMAIKIPQAPVINDNTLCPCLGITPEQVVTRMEQGKLQSPEAVLSVMHLGEGKCHGQFCMGAFKRLMADQGLDVSNWIDWRFPWSEWVLKHN